MHGWSDTTRTRNILCAAGQSTALGSLAGKLISSA
jgi:hypothetical protein